jgi:uncharacterized protein YdaU (DUF1376 family)
MHYYKRNLGDYAKKCGRLTMLQHGAYTLLIDSCYDREVFPTLEQAIEWTWASTEQEIEAVKFVLSRFFKLSDDGTYVQDRILSELLEYHAKADTNKRIAIERETKRKQGSTNRAPDVDEPPPNHKPITINQEPVTKKDKKATEVACPSDVGLQEWTDWLALRKAKKAPVTETVVKSARKEAEKAGISLNAFLTIWCARGSQGLEASWLKSDEKQMQTETVYQKSMRLRVQEVAPDIARQEPYQDQVQFFRTIDITPQVQLIEEQK